MAAVDEVLSERRATKGNAARSFKSALKRLILIAIAMVAVVSAARYAHRWWIKERFVESTDDAYVGGDNTLITPRIAGFVRAILVSDNQLVTKGQTLLQLDDREPRLALEQAEAIVRQRASSLEQLKARSVLQNELIRQAAADLDQKTAQAGFTKSDAVRYGSLANTTAVTRQETERALSLSRASIAAVAAARAGLDGAKQQLVILRAQMAEAEARTAEARAEVDLMRLKLEYTQIRSPIDGAAGNRTVRQGAYVQVGAHLMTIVPRHGLWIDANFKEDQLQHIKVGDVADIFVDVAPDTPMRGHVASFAPSTGAVFSIIPPENATGNFTKIVQRVPVRIALDGNDGLFGRVRPGLSATVSIDTRDGR